MESKSALSCLACNSERVVVGRVNIHKVRKLHPWSSVAPAFTPNELQKNHLWPPGLRIEPEAGAVLCVDCGLVWTSVNTADAEQKLNKYGSQDLKSRLGLES